MERRARLAPPSAPAAPLHGKGKQRGGAAACAAAASRISVEAGSDDSAAAVAAGEATAAAEEAVALRPPGGAFFVDGGSAEGQRVGDLPGGVGLLRAAGFSPHLGGAESDRKAPASRRGFSSWALVLPVARLRESAVRKRLKHAFWPASAVLALSGDDEGGRGGGGG
jgi:hypothetical protein